MSTLLSKLNPEQLAAVTATEGFVRVIAGAGSGKTRALTHRFAYLVQELGILPGNILCVTFTNKAANEMRQRIHNLTGDNDTGYINTFHGFCVSVLQEDSYAVQYPKSFLVLDNSDIDEMLRQIYEERGLSLRDMTFSQARDMIEMEKLVRRPDYYLDMIHMSIDTLRQKYDRATAAKDVIFYGASRDVPALMQAMDLFALPSHFEGLPVVGVEAQAAGLPVLYSDRITRQAKLTDDVWYLPVGQGDAGQWADAAAKIAGMDIDRTTGYEKVMQAGYTIDNTVRDFLRLYGVTEVGE